MAPSTHEYACAFNSRVDASMLKILGKPISINVRKVTWLCGELGLPFDLELHGAGYRTTDTAEFRALNPNALVPVIIDRDAGEDVVLWESNTICRYLAARAGRDDLLPRAPIARARVEQWMDWQAGELNNAWRYAFLGLVRKSPDHQDPEAIEQSVAQWNRHMAILDGQLRKTGGYAAGPGFTLADIGLGLAVNRWIMTPIQHADLPAVARYYDLLGERPAFREHGRNGTP
jgi:glutathione S-transferase